MESLKEIQHDNILELLGVYEDPKFYYLVTAKYESVPISETMFQKGKQFSESDAATFLKQLLQSLNCYHQQSLYFGSLSPSGIIYDLTKDVDERLLIVDYPLQLQLNSKHEQLKKAGYYAFDAPELNQEYWRRVSIKAADGKKLKNKDQENEY